MSAPLHQPTATEIQAKRLSLSLSVSEAAAVVHVNKRTWYTWESIDNRSMPLGLWELFIIKTSNPLPNYDYVTVQVPILREVS